MRSQSARNTCVRAWTRPRSRMCSRPQCLQALFVRSTCVRRSYASARTDCLRLIFSACSSIRSSTLYLMSRGSSVLRGLYGAIGTIDCSSSQSCHLSISNSESPRNQRGVSTASASRVTRIAISSSTFFAGVNAAATGIFCAAVTTQQP